MAAPLIVSIPHGLGRDEAMRRLKTGLSRATSHLPILRVDEERWEDSRMMFRVRALGQAAHGHVDVAEDHWTYPLPLNVSITRCASTVGSAASGAGFIPRRSRIHAACRDSTDTIRAAARSDALVRFGACAL